MPNDNQTEEVVLPQENNTEVSENTEEVKPEVTEPESAAEKEPEVDYRGKLNATNNFLKKEGYEFKDGKWVKTKKESVQTESKVIEGGLSIKDAKAIQDIHEDDVEDVVEWAKFKKISIAEAKKSDHIKTLLKEKEEQRKTAAASNTGIARRSSVKLSDAEVVERASKGEFPEDPAVLARAQENLKRKKG
jgi:hypothetical protein